MTDPDRLEISLFGTLTLRRGSEDLPLISSSDAKNLLVFLALNRGRPHPRSVVVGQFWEDLAESRARRALSQALWHLRKALPEALDVTPTHIALALSPRIWVDVGAFEALVGPQIEARPKVTPSAPQRAALDLRAALELYRGDLLEDFDDYWILIERERLRERFGRALARLIDLEKAAGRYAEALDLAQRVVHLDPLREESHREVMRLYYILKRPGEAWQQYQTCCSLLDDELGVGPEQETEELAYAIGDRSDESPRAVYLPARAERPSTRGTAIPLVGRSGERARMLAAIEGLFRGEHAVVLIDGEPGIGKTRFLDEIARDAEWRGLQPLRGAFEEGESSPPFSAIVAAIGRALNPLRIEQLAGIAPRTALQVLTPLVPALSAHLRELGAAATIDANSRQGRLLDAFAQLLFAWSRLHPLLIILEDLQWADRDSLILLEHALESFATAPRGFHGIGLAVSYRLADARGRSEVWQTIERLDRRRVAQRLTLSAFDESATRELLRRAMHEATLPAAFEERLHAESGGNPLFLIETLRVLQERGVVSRDDDGRWHTPFDAPNASLDELALPREVERVIESRLESLPDELRQTLVAATVLGSEFDFGQLGAVVAQSPERLSDSVRQLRERQFVEESPDALRFSHTKVRQVAYAQLLESERLELHRKAAQTLENQQQTRLEAMAHHYVEGRIWDKAVTFGIKAGEQAEAVHANRAALQHYRRAHEILERQQPFSPDRRLYLAFDLLEGISRLLGLVGETTEQQQALHRLQQCAKALGNPERQARAFNQMATFLCSRLDFYDAAEKAARTAYDFAMKHHLLSQAAEALEIIGTSHEMRDQLDEAEAALRESHALWETLDPFSTATLRLKRELATVFWKMRRLDEAEQLCLETLPLADELDDHQTLTQLYKMLAVFSGKRADFGAVQRYQEIALEHVRRAGVRSDEATILANQALALREVGRLGPALRQMRQALELEQQLALRRGIALSAYNLAYLLLEVGQLDEVEQLTERVGRPQLAAIDSLSAELLYRCNDAIWQNERGAFDEAAAIAQEATNRAVETGMRYHEALLRLNWGLALLRGGSGAEAETQLKQALTIWREIGERVFAITTHSFIAEALRRQGLTERALCEIDVAVSALEKTTALDLPHAGYLIRARILDDLGRSDEARQALEQALGAFEALAETLDDEREREIFRRVPQLSRELFSFSREFSARAFGVRISVRLPCCEAPLGRPLRDDELVEVAWTVSSPDDQVHRSRTARRQAQIRRLLVEARQAGAAPSYNHIADALGVSSRTIERDMLQLRQQFPDLPPTRR